MDSSKLNKEYRRCKRNLALCKRMDKKRKSNENSEHAKAIRKVNRTYRRCLHDYLKNEKKEKCRQHRIDMGKVKWCTKHFGESIEHCKLSDSELETLGSTALDITQFVLGFLFLPITFIIVGIYDGITTSDNYIHRHNIVK